MRKNWQLWSGVISSNVCDQIVKTQLEIPPITATTFGSDNPDYRKSKIRWVNDDAVKRLLWHYAREANRNAFGFDLTDISPVQFTEYNSEQLASYDWHHDIDWESDSAFDRKVSVVVQLSDPDSYNGCDFYFNETKNPEVNSMRAKGTVLCFPSYLTHRVSEITKGTRHSLVAWFEGPRWR